MAFPVQEFVFPMVAPNLEMSFVCHGDGLERLPLMPHNVLYEWSDHWVYSHVELPNGNVMLTQLREPAWRCGEL
jgi:hypothetical protein